MRPKSPKQLNLPIRADYNKKLNWRFLEFKKLGVLLGIQSSREKEIEIEDARLKRIDSRKKT